MSASDESIDHFEVGTRKWMLEVDDDKGCEDDDEGSAEAESTDADAVLDKVVYSSYKALISSLQARKEVKTLANKCSDQAEEIKILTEKVARLEEELKELVTQANVLAAKAVIKSRGETLLEFKLGKSDQWDVEGELADFREVLPQEYDEVHRQVTHAGANPLMKKSDT